MIVDINAFIGKWPYWPVRASSGGEVAGELEGWGIDQAAICSTRSVFVHCEDGNREALQAAIDHPGRFMAFACLGAVELSHTLLPQRHDLSEVARAGYRGIRLYPQHHSYHPLHTPYVENLMEDAEALRLPVLLPHRIIMNWGMPSLDLGVIEALVERHPKTVWILAGINYLHELQLAVHLMKRFETVHVETSCLMGFHAIAKLVEQCGSGQILFGSGAPLQNGAAGVEKVLRAKIHDAARQDILEGNARRLLRDFPETRRD